MQRTRIELVSSGSIDMFDDVSTPLNFAIADIRTPESRDASYSKTIKIPATKTNNQLFTHIFDLNIRNSSYNPNRKADCILYYDDVPQIYGYLQLQSIEVDDKDDMIYNCVIRGNVGNIFLSLGDTYLRDLDLSTYNHTLNRTNQKASWTNTYSNGYVYPMIDYGFDNSFNAWQTEHFLPAVFVRTIIDKIFSQAGYTYQSTFFDSTHFKKLIIPANDVLKYTDSEVAGKLFNATKSSTQNIPTTGITMATPSTYPVLEFDTETLDPANAYKTAQYRWEPPSNGYYNLIVDANINTSGTIVGLGGSIPTLIGFRKHDTITGTYTLMSSTSWMVSTAQTIRNTQWNVYLKTTDRIQVVILPTSGLYINSSIQWQFNSTSSRFYNSIPNTGMQYGDTIDISKALPDKTKCKDFLSDIIRMFNLYVDVDKTNSKKLIIETRNDFYSSGTIVDWTSKLDYSQPVEITPMGDLDFKVFNYKYKQDKDFYNASYSQKYLEDYGNRKVEVDNDFLTSTKDMNVMFSATPMVCSQTDDKVMPKIFEVDSNNAVKQKPFNVRLLYYGGVINTSYSWSYTDNGVGYTETTYPYCGHLDSLTAPTIDLCFGVPKELYYNTTVYTNANLYNLYHRKYIDEITDADSKIVVGYFYLTPKDIADLDFRNRFYFENQYFRLNKVYDYDPINERPTKCEFIKIKDAVQVATASATTNGGTGTLGAAIGTNKDTYPILAPNGNRTPIIVQGNRNYVADNVRNGIVIGNDNYVHGGENITLLNSSGCIVYDGLQNVTILNSSGTIVTESNTLYVNGASVNLTSLSQAGSPWSSVTYSSSDYYAQGGGTWTVDSGDLITSKYKIVGKTMHWNVYIDTSTTSGSPSQLAINVPEGKTIAHTFVQKATIAYSGTSDYKDANVVGNDGSTVMYIQRLYGTSMANVADYFSVIFSITFEID